MVDLRKTKTCFEQKNKKMSGDNKENKSMFSFFGSKSEDPDLNIPGRLLIHVLIIKVRNCHVISRCA